MSIETLKARMTEINDSINLLSGNITGMSVAQIMLRKKLARLNVDNERAAFNTFATEQEDKQEAASAVAKPQVNMSLAQHLVSLTMGDDSESQLETIIAAKGPALRFGQRAPDDLSGDDDTPTTDLSHLPDDPNAVATIYKKPDAAELIVEAKDAQVGSTESFAMNIILNEKQVLAKDMALAGKNFVLIGPAGSGKTTAQRAVAEALLEDKRLGYSTFKTYDELGNRSYKQAPSIAFCAYTRRAAANLAKAVYKSPVLEAALPYNILTIHALLEFEPEEYFCPIEAKMKFRFAPVRTAANPLDITHLVIEEASMLGLDLWEQLYAALPAGVQIIFIGDINQLPPVFGPSILNYALVQLPIVELTTTYRNQGIVLDNAHNILRGDGLEENEHFVIMRGKSPVVLGQQKMSFMLGAVFKQLHELIDSTDGLLSYDPEDCIILSPFNKQDLGTDNLNKWIAQFLGEKRGAIVHELIAGFNKLYLAVGDKVMFNKRDCVVTSIERNVAYHGKEPQLPGSDLSRFGVRIIGKGQSDSLDDISLDYSTFSLEALENDKLERKQQCSHEVKVTYDDGRFDVLRAVGDFGPQVFSLGYALTVHKAQGSEWRKVFLILHKDHAVALYRELFYTAVTRARTKVTIIAKDPTIEKAIKNQRIKGDTLEDKLEFFNSGADMRDGVYASKIQIKENHNGLQ